MITLKKIATYKKVWFLHALFAWLWLGISAQAHADSYDDLYELAGWKQQAVHFEQALPLLQQEITQKTGFTPSISWQPQAFQRKATETLRKQLVSPQAALDFFNSKAGKQVVKAEVSATQLSKIKAYRQQPSWSLDVTRQRELDRLRASLPIQKTLNQLQSQIVKQQTSHANLNIPGLGDLSALTSGALQNITLFKPSTYDLNQAMIIVYGDLSHPELKAFADFAESPEGQAYYNACVQMLQF